jgi:hypothetical protein
MWFDCWFLRFALFQPTCTRRVCILWVMPLAVMFKSRDCSDCKPPQSRWEWRSRFHRQCMAATLWISSDTKSHLPCWCTCKVELCAIWEQAALPLPQRSSWQHMRWASQFPRWQSSHLEWHLPLLMSGYMCRHCTQWCYEPIGSKVRLAWRFLDLV